MVCSGCQPAEGTTPCYYPKCLHCQLRLDARSSVDTSFLQLLAPHHKPENTCVHSGMAQRLNNYLGQWDGGCVHDEWKHKFINVNNENCSLTNRRYCTYFMLSSLCVFVNERDVCSYRGHQHSSSPLPSLSLESGWMDGRQGEREAQVRIDQSRIYFGVLFNTANKTVTKPEKVK